MMPPSHSVFRIIRAARITIATMKEFGNVLAHKVLHHVSTARMEASVPANIKNKVVQDHQPITLLYPGFELFFGHDDLRS